MIRNLLSNALKYTAHGKVLLGCRRRNGRLRIEVWDTGAGIPEDKFEEIFEEYRQLGNGGHDRTRGLGLGLSIVRRLGGLLGHKVDVRSQVDKGSVFSVEVKISSDESAPLRKLEQRAPVIASIDSARRDDVILVIEDNREVRELLELALREEGFCVASAVDGEAALELAASGGIEPDVILADFNLPKGMNGAMTVENLRKDLRRDIPAVILTGDISIETLRDLDRQNWVRLNKPVNIKELTQTIRHFAAAPVTSRQAPAPQKDSGRASGPPFVFVVDDDRNIREEFRDMLEKQGWRVKAYGACETFLEEFEPGGECCLLVDSVLPGMSGTALLQHLQKSGVHLPAIMITGYGDVRTAVSAMKMGAIDFIEKPVAAERLIAAVESALDAARHVNTDNMRREIVENRLASLTPRQRDVLGLVLAGHPSKNIAADLRISQRTVENHRAAIMERTGAKSIPELVRLMVARA
jgi:two-component system CheB/CheR fusion protein